MSTTLEKARAALKKNKKVDMANRVELDPTKASPVPAISTGSIVVDYMIGGTRLPSGEYQCPGIPRGRITEIFGPEGSGKTTLALETAVRAQKEGGTVCFLDYENAIAPTYARNLGVDFSDDKFDLFTPITWEEGAEIIRIMSEAGVDLIIVDSVSAMVPQATFEKDPSEQGQIGLLARLQSGFLPNMVNSLRKSGTALVYLNQMRSRIKTSKYDSGPDEDTSGGRALKYYASLRLKVKRVKTEYNQIDNALTGDKEKQPICNIVRGQCVKNKVAPHQGHTADFVIRYGEGIDQVRSLIDIGCNRGVIKQAGAWYTFYDAEGNEQKLQGKEDLRTYMLQNQSTFQMLVGELKSMSFTEVKKLDEEDADGQEEAPSVPEATPAAAPASSEAPAAKTDPGIESVIQRASDKGLIWQAGPWYKFHDANSEEQAVRGKTALVEFFQTNPDVLKHMAGQVKDTLRA